MIDETDFRLVLDEKANLDYIEGINDAFDALSKCCKYRQFTYDEDSHCSGYYYCLLKSFSDPCTKENCICLLEDKDDN